MIFKTPIAVTVPGEIIGKDPRGNPIYSDPVVTTHYGEFRPLQGDEDYRTGENITQRFRVFLPPSAGETPGTSSLEILGHAYQLVGNTEPHNIGGRVHHYEVVVERVTG